MITFSESKKAPKIFNENRLGAKWAGIDALKDIHVSFNGYGIAEDEKVHFPTAEMIAKAPTSFVKIMATREGSKNKSAFVRVIREKDGITRESYVNMSMFSRVAYTENGERVMIDDARTNLCAMNDDAERLSYLLGKTVSHTGTMDAYGPKFDREKGTLVRDEDGNVVYTPQTYATIEVSEPESAEENA